MATSLKPIHLVLIIYLCLADGWPQFSSLFGSKDDTVGNSGRKEDDNVDRQKRSLSSFDKYSHTIPDYQLVTLRGRRDIEVSVKAHTWPTTIISPLCEAWSFLDDSIGKTRSSSSTKGTAEKESLGWRYLDLIAKNGGIPPLDIWADWSNQGDGYENSLSWSNQDSSELALQMTSLSTKSTRSTLDLNLLRMSLSLRARSPHCEMHRSLARDAAIVFGLYDVDSDTSPPAAFAVVSHVARNGNNGTKVVLGTRVLLDESLLPAALHALKSGDRIENNGDQGSYLVVPLPDEAFHPGYQGDDDIVAILYGHVGTTTFASMYLSLIDSQIKFVVRHMGYIPYEEETTMKSGASPPRATPTVLQGYGVRLDIRNVEYKAFDDGPADKSKDGDADPDWNEAGHDPESPARNEFLAGVNLKKLLGRFQGVKDAPLKSDMQALQTALIQSHPAQARSESIVPPAWQRRPLALQAAIVIASSTDPLETLKGISQNLPSVAHSLSNVQVPELFEDLAEEASNLATEVGAISPGWGDAAFGLFVNGRLVDVERPSFNVFQLLDVLREEANSLHELELKFKPIFQDALMVWRGSGEQSLDAQWAALQAVKRIFDMGIEQLMKVGKHGLFDNENSAEKVQHENHFGQDESLSLEKIRVDVGRGSKTSVLYLNDIERDPEYNSWPSSVQEMLYRSQYGGAPTVRRNLFTMLVVLDPTSGAQNLALSVVSQLLRGQFPLRLGVLIVNDEDVSRGSALPPEPWQDGERNFHARDAFLLLRHIKRKYGSMIAISCLLQISYEFSESSAMSVKEYVDLHVSTLMEMRVIDTGHYEKYEMEVLLGNSNTGAEPNDISYESSVQYAVDKLISPGMSFFNGIPMPDGSGFEAGVNEILQYEQRHIMELIMTGVITDTAPRSIYAKVLSGDKLYKQFHPLLKEGVGEYTVTNSDWRSLIFPKHLKPTDYNNVHAMFLVEGVFDLGSPVGINFAVSFLDLISSPPPAWHESKTSLAFRITPSTTPSSPQSQVLANILCIASQFDPDDIKTVLKIFHGTTSQETIADVITSIEHSGISGMAIETMITAGKGETSCAQVKPISREKENFFVANGRVYAPIDSSTGMTDLSLLVRMEMDRTHAITKIILPHLLLEAPEQDGSHDEQECLALHQAIGTSAAVLGDIMISASSSSPGLPDIAASVDSLQTGKKNPLYFSWNDDSSSARYLQVKVSVILDPLIEPTQRVAPLLLAIRDVLKLPLRLMIAPRKVVQNDFPLSSYYRFVADPSALSNSKPSNALFENLPTNHVLTLRMDVPEMWDVQQSKATQDADNLRCDSRSGCGDYADVIYGGRDSGIEKATIEYGLKSLLFFGQCYDVSKNTPPNGLQLTLNRARSSDIHSKSVAEFHSDGSQSLSNQVQLLGSNDSTDTLVMKTVGYWQLRANPGVWDLRIASKSRGADIFEMVEGIITRSGRVQLVKNSAPTNSKTLVMKDFTNQGSFLLVKRKKGFEDASLFDEKVNLDASQRNETVHVFSLATGHAYERLLKIMMLSVTKRTSSPVKFWLFENVSIFLSNIHVTQLRWPSLRSYFSFDLSSFSRPLLRPLRNSWLSVLDVKWNS
jgi:UDP-glucose:glycoprotein glucosyltransferase